MYYLESFYVLPYHILIIRGCKISSNYCIDYK